MLELVFSGTRVLGRKKKGGDALPNRRSGCYSRVQMCQTGTVVNAIY